MSIHLLAATDWVLVEVDGQPLAQGVLPPTATIQHGKIAGFGGCNRYAGPVDESRPGVIKVGALVATRMACDAAANELETKFLEHLGNVDAFTFQAGRLVLSGPTDAHAARSFLVFSR